MVDYWILPTYWPFPTPPKKPRKWTALYMQWTKRPFAMWRPSHDLQQPNQAPRLPLGFKIPVELCGYELIMAPCRKEVENVSMRMRPLLPYADRMILHWLVRWHPTARH